MASSSNASRWGTRHWRKPAANIPPPKRRAQAGAPDADASYTRKYNQSFYDYKAHVSSDGGQLLIRVAAISTASQYAGEVWTHIAPAGSEVIYADKACDTKANQAWLRANGLRNGIFKKRRTTSNSPMRIGSATNWN